MRILNCMIVFLIVATNPIFGQTSDDQRRDLYPEKYTFEKAAEFEQNGEYQKAVWFYINLFPDHKTEVIELIKALETKLDTVDMPRFVKMTFGFCATLDPTIISFQNGSMVMNSPMLKMKGAWGDELIQKISDPNKPLNNASEYNFRAIDMAKEGKYKEAILNFDTAIMLKPTGQIYFNRAYTKSMNLDFSSAIKDFDKAIELRHRLDEAYFERGYCKFQIDDRAGAIEDYTNAIKQNKEHVDAYNNRAFTKLMQKDYKAAIKDFDKALKIDPNYAGAYLNRGFAQNELGHKSAACKDWQKAADLGMEEGQQFINDNCKK